MKLGNRTLTKDSNAYIIAEIGINHNGNIDIAKKLIDVAKKAGCDAVKFQKRNPDVCVPEKQKSIMRETPWGYISYLDYKYKVEFEKEEYDIINEYCKKNEIHWFASPWDVDSVNFLSQYDIPALKVPSASLNDKELLLAMAKTNIPIIISTGMSTQNEVDEAVSILKDSQLAVLHCVSTYPTPTNELNLNVIKTFQSKYPNLIIGYSGHETGLSTTYAAVAMGAKIIERHITLDRSMWGTDHSASIEPHGLKTLVSNIRDIESALGDGIKAVTPGEVPIREKLRRIQ
jgi:N-acetylneuraminate synthase